MESVYSVASDSSVPQTQATPLKRKPVGHHIMLDMWNCRCPDEVLEKEEHGIALMERLGTFFTPLGLQCYQFEPYGWTATLMLAESHIAGHVWKERDRYAAFCLFTCCGSIPEDAVEVILETLQPLNYKRLDSSRGPMIEQSPVLSEHVRLPTIP